MFYTRFSKPFLFVLAFLLITGSVLLVFVYRRTRVTIVRAPSIKVTLPEGLTNMQMSSALNGVLPLFNTEMFIDITYTRQGYLFPDTYFFTRESTTEDVIGIMHMNFNKKIKALQADIDRSGRSLNDIITMASLIEEEARSKDDAGIISGILWKRLSINMPLQVDVDRSTYTNRGLPERPVSNPGLSSIQAALHPVTSAYLYYLHDKNGMVHYAKDFAEHKRNIAKYL